MTEKEIMEALAKKVSVTMMVSDWQTLLGAHDHFIRDSEFIKVVDQLIVKRLGDKAFHALNEASLNSSETKVQLAKESLIFMIEQLND